MNHLSNITAGKKIIPVSDITFDSILDEACERLLHRQVKYAIQRIHEMENRLGSLERELDEFLSINKHNEPRRKARRTAS